MSQPVLDIVALRSLTAIADRGGFHRAARALALSQSAVSQHVRRLEKTLGRPIVEREGRGTRFTPEGRLLLEQARRILAVHDEAVRTLLDVDGDTVTIGSTEHAADQFLPRLTAAVQEVRPGCRVRFRIDRSARLVEAVERGSVDVAVYVTEAAATEGTPVGGLPLTWHATPAGSHRPRPRPSRWSPSRTPARSAAAPSPPSPRTAYPPRSSATRAISPESSTSPVPGRASRSSRRSVRLRTG